MRKGFTLIELMIVIAIIAIIAAIAIPSLIQNRLTANEAAASGTLKTIQGAMVTFQGSSTRDEDLDGVGEYGIIKQMTGAFATPKDAARKLDLLPGTLQTTTRTTPAGLPQANNYFFLAVVPRDTAADGTNVTLLGDDRAAQGDCDTATITPGNNANNGEKQYVVGAAPDVYNESGRRVFVLSNDGQVRSPAVALNVTPWFPAGYDGDPATTTQRTPTAATILLGMQDFCGASAVIGDGAAGDIMEAPKYTEYPIVAR